MSRARIRWAQHPNEAADYLDAFGDRMIEDIASLIVQPAQDMLRYAKANHPWVNQTGEAEAGLNIKIEVDGDTILIHLDHAAEHGKWLEHRWNGRWGVIPESISYGAPRVMAAITSYLRS